MGAVGAKSYNFEASSVEKRNVPCTQLPELNHSTPVTLPILTRKKSSTPEEESATTEIKECSILTEKLHQSRLLNIILICVIVMSSLISLWFILGPKKNNLIPQNTNAAMHMSVFFDNNEDIGPAGEQFEEVTYQTRSPSRPLRLLPTSRRKNNRRLLALVTFVRETRETKKAACFWRYELRRP
ncbi:Hypothetical predicted protein [Cloeon dipterum]|uniref:Uncharacterized protein n=1 Tax=Cloeon dipterum TaxID=197152 RepID=A0A8S1D9V0_9INSE|nr:Hypothetical predicted protein [Cloeon dipterum]